MPSKAEKAAQAAVNADDAVLDWGEQVAARYIVQMNKVARMGAQAMVAALGLETDKRGHILLNAANIQRINRAAAVGDAKVNAELAKLAEGAFGGWVTQAAEAGAQAFAVTMKAAGESGFRIGINSALRDMAQRRVITLSKSLSVQSLAKTQNVIFDMMRGRRTISDLRDFVSAESGVNESLAATIARSETFATYRAAQDEQYRDNGYEFFQMTGPLDSTTSEICRQYLGRIMTRDEWLSVSELVFDYGLHPNCRHSWIGVKESWMDKTEWGVARDGNARSK